MSQASAPSRSAPNLSFVYSSATPRPASPPSTSLVGPALTALALHAVLLAAYLAVFHGDISALVCADSNLIGHAPFEAVTTGFVTGGYDGQFYYVLAQNPWRMHTQYMDFAAYRHCRILYPTLAWLVTGGDPVALLWALPAINLLAIALLAALGARLAVHYRRSSWWGFLLPLGANVGMSTMRDLTDPLATLTVVGLLSAWLLKDRPWTLLAWGIAAVLSREQNVAVVGIVGLVALLARDWLRAGMAAAAGLVFIAWAATLHQLYGALPFSPGSVAAPFQGMASRWALTLAARDKLRFLMNAGAVGFVALQIFLCVSLPFFRAERTTALLGLAGAALAVLAAAPLYHDFYAYARVFVWLPLAVWLWSIQSGRSWPAWLMAPAALWPALAIVHICLLRGGA